MTTTTLPKSFFLHFFLEEIQNKKRGLVCLWYERSKLRIKREREREKQRIQTNITHERDVIPQTQK